jgi:hypothetical protein
VYAGAIFFAWMDCEAGGQLGVSSDVA